MAKKENLKKSLVHIVKRRGHSEVYDEKKVYASVYAAALNCHYSEIESEKVAKPVMQRVNKWVMSKKIITSDEIKHQIIAYLGKDVALMYKHHLDVC